MAHSGEYDLPAAVLSRIACRNDFLLCLNRLCPDVIAELRELSEATDWPAGLMAWAEQHHLSDEWIVRWATYAGYAWRRWQLPASTSIPVEEAKGVLDVVSPDQIRVPGTVHRLPYSPPAPDLFFLVVMQEADATALEPHSQSAVHHFERELRKGFVFHPPHPLKETRAEFIARAAEAWDSAVRMSQQLLPPELRPIPRSKRLKLRQHLEWLIRHQVHEQTAAKIAESLPNPDRELAGIHDRIKDIAAQIGLTLRPARGRRSKSKARNPK